MFSKVLTARNLGPTLQRYVSNILGVALNIILVVAILGYFGVETTSFAALVAGLGLAIGAACRRPTVSAATLLRPPALLRACPQ